MSRENFMAFLAALKLKNRHLRIKKITSQWAKSPKKAVCRSVFLTTWHCNFAHWVR